MIDRRTLLGATALGGGGLLLGLGMGRRDLAAAAADSRFHGESLLGDGQADHVWYRYKFIGQPIMDTQLMFWLGQAPSGLCDIGEVLDTATRITAGDEVSWFEQWSDTATRVQGYGEEAEKRGHLRSAGSHFRRAGAYWRAGLIRYAAHADPRLVEATRKALHCHDRSLDLLGYDSREIEIPYEDSSLYGRIYLAPDTERAPFVVLHQGLHAWPEDTMWVIDGALERGYHVLAFHGPGQGASLRLNGLPFRPDWEAVVGPVLDFAEGVDQLDMDAAILMGLSFGGYLAPRAAAYEPRVATLVADPGVLNWGEAMMANFGAIPGVLELYERGPAAFDATIGAVTSLWPDAAWYFEDATWKHGVSKPHELIDELRLYDNSDAAPKIRCRTLIMDGVAEDATPGQSKRLYDALTCPKTLMMFDASTAAQTHCQGGGTLLAQARLFDWLDEEVRA